MRWDFVFNVSPAGHCPFDSESYAGARGASRVCVCLAEKEIRSYYCLLPGRKEIRNHVRRHIDRSFWG